MVGIAMPSDARMNADSRLLPPGVLCEIEQETKEARPPNGYLFLCSNRTERECLERKLFGAPKSEWDRVSQVKEGDILFLLNYQSNRLHGVFEAASDGKMNIEPYAFDGYFPAQVRVRRKMRCPWLDETTLLPLIKRGWIKVSRRGVLLFPPVLGPRFIDELWRIFLQVAPVPRIKHDLVGYKAKDGHVTKSYGERYLDEWLHENLPYKHEYNCPVKRAKREVVCDWYIPKIDLYIEYWEKTRWRETSGIELKHKFYKDHSLRAIDIYEDDLRLADRIIPARIREAAPQCKFKKSRETRGKFSHCTLSVSY